MRKWFVSLAIVAMVAAPTFAQMGPVTTIVTNYSSDRPTVDIGPLGATINWANNSGGYGSRWVDGVNVEVNVAFASMATGHTAWAMETGIAGEWAVYGGPPLDNFMPINVEHLPTGVITSIPTTGTPTANNHLTDINENGDVFWMNWNNILMQANVANPLVVNQLSAGPAYQRMRVADSTDRAAFTTDNANVAIYDLGWDGADAPGAYVIAVEKDLGGALGMQSFFKTEISDDGKFVVGNVRYVGVGGLPSDIVLWDASAGLGAVVETNLTGDNVTAPAYCRNDPSMTMVDADTAIIVWDENPAGHYDLVGAYVTGLSTGTPVMGPQWTIAGGAGDQRFGDIDGALVAWKNTSTGTIQYRMIPEPASIGLLVLGGLALIRRR